jgi:acetyl-CoA synthetase
MQRIATQNACARLDWIKPFTKVKDVSFDPDDFHIKWFEDGTLNVSANCIDRHLPRADRPRSSGKATIRDSRKHHLSRAARRGLPLRQCAEGQGVKKGDRVTIYLPMIPEAAYAMLACARIGAVHSVVFGGFSPDSLAGRIQDCDSTVVITADEGLRGGKPCRSRNVDEALKPART